MAHSTYYTKQLNLWCTSLASHVVNCSQLSICLSRKDEAIHRPLVHSGTSNKPQNNQKVAWKNFQHYYLSELLFNVYNYNLIVKSMSCCCVCGS